MRLLLEMLLPCTAHHVSFLWLYCPLCAEHKFFQAGTRVERGRKGMRAMPGAAVVKAGGERDACRVTGEQEHVPSLASPPAPEH